MIIQEKIRQHLIQGGTKRIRELHLNSILMIKILPGYELPKPYASLQQSSRLEISHSLLQPTVILK